MLRVKATNNTAADVLCLQNFLHLHFSSLERSCDHAWQKKFSLFFFWGFDSKVINNSEPATNTSWMSDWQERIYRSTVVYRVCYLFWHIFFFRKKVKSVCVWSDERDSSVKDKVIHFCILYFVSQGEIIEKEQSSWALWILYEYRGSPGVINNLERNDSIILFMGPGVPSNMSLYLSLIHKKLCCV